MIPWSTSWNILAEHLGVFLHPKGLTAREPSKSDGTFVYDPASF